MRSDPEHLVPLGLNRSGSSQRALPARGVSSVAPGQGAVCGYLRKNRILRPRLWHNFTKRAGIYVSDMKAPS